MKSLYAVVSLTFLLIISQSTFAQTHFSYTGNTGNNASVSVPQSINPSIDGQTLSSGDEIGVFTPAGLCVGAIVWTEENNVITVWGNNPLTDEIDGIEPGEEIHYKIWRQSTNTEYDYVEKAYSMGDGIYVVDGLYVLSELNAISLPSAPTLSSPSDNATGVAVNPTLSWNASTGADSYTVQVSKNSNMSSPVVNQSGITGTSYAVNGLENGQQYYWRVRAVNAAGNSSWSGIWNFTTIVAAPSTPTLSSPSNNATGVAVNPTLSWNASSDAESYRVQVSKNSNMSSPVVDQSGISGTSYSVSSLDNNTQYYWRVRASNAGGTSSWSSTWNFTTIVAAPSAPTLSSPSNNATGVAVDPTLDWNASSGADSYTVQVSKNSNMSSPVVNQSGISGTSYSVSGLESNTQYYWRVRAVNDGGTSSWSSTWNFTTIIAAPSAPTLSSPSNNATGVAVNPTLSWNTSSGAESYTVQVSKNSNMSSPVVNQSGITGTSYAVSGLENGTQYYWRVRAVNTAGNSSWSSTWNFTTIVSAPSAPTLSSPSNNATGVSTSPTLAWNPSSGAESYRVQVSLKSNMSSPVVDQTGVTGTSYEVSGLDHGQQYYWRVRAWNEGGGSEWSSVWNFTTNIGAPSAPTLSSPSNNATGVAVNPTMSWNETSGAESYTLQISKNSNMSSPVVYQSGITGTSYEVSGLENDTQYYWRVRAVNANGEGDWSGIWNFTTIVAAPSTPTLSSPSNNATDTSVNPVLEWNASSGADTYTVQVSKNSNMSSPVVNQSGISGTSYNVSGLDNNTQYYWRVRAVNEGGNSSWSGVWNFTTIVALPLTPVLVSPSNNAVDVSVNPALTWEASTDAESYTVQVSKNSNLSSPVVNQSGVTGTSYQVSGLDNSTQYYWRVRAVNAAGNSNWSATRNFTTEDIIVSSSIALQTGWNIVSSRIIPAENDIETLFSEVVEDVVLVKNGNGDLYWPAQGVNNIGEWDYKSGYQVYMSTERELQFEGTAAEPAEDPIELAAGWSMVAYFGDTARDPAIALESLGSDLVIAKNNSGGVYWPEFGTNTMGNMIPGQGYQVYLVNTATLVYPGPGTTASNDEMVGLSSYHPERYVLRFEPTGVNATILVRSSSFVDGDEVGVYTAAGDLVGSGVTHSGSVLLTVWGKDEIATAGADTGDRLSLVYYSAVDNDEQELNIESVTDAATGESVQGRLSYAPNGIYVVSASKQRQESVSASYALAQNYPNPFNPTTMIRFNLPEAGYTTLKIYDMTGREVASLVDDHLTAGEYTVQWIANDVSTGTYFYRLESGYFIETKKLLLVK